MNTMNMKDMLRVIENAMKRNRQIYKYLLEDLTGSDLGCLENLQLQYLVSDIYVKHVIAPFIGTLVMKQLKTYSSKSSPLFFDKYHIQTVCEVRLKKYLTSHCFK